MSGNQWVRDEYLVTLDLYLNHPEIVEDSSDPDVRSAAELIDRTPGAVALRLANYRYLDPQSSKGMSNVSEGCREIWEEYYGNEEELAYEAERARERLRSTGSGTEQEDSNTIETSEIYVDGKRRQGQGDFRSAIRSRFEDECILCDVSTPGLLQAAHILDWSEFEELRGDPDNGLLLCYTHHRAFDLEMFTISDSFEVVTRPGFTGGGTFLARTLEDRDAVQFPNDPPSKEYLRRHNDCLSWWSDEDDGSGS